MYNSQSPRNGFPKDSYETLWDSLEDLLLNSISTSFLKEELSSSQKLVVI